MAEHEKWVWIVTGPNGAGKSTLWNSLADDKLKALPYFNPDEDARKALETRKPNEPDLDIQKVHLDLFKEQVARIEEYERNGTSFAMENSSPARRTFALVNRLKGEGWKVGVIAVGIATQELGEKRVEDRAAQGGHTFNPAFPHLYRGSMESIPKLIALSDKAVLYDNSGAGFQEIARRDAPDARMTLAVNEADIPPGNIYMRTMLANLRKANLLPEAPGRKI